MENPPTQSVFLASSLASKALSSLHMAFFEAMTGPDQEVPELDNNKRVLLLHKLYDMFAELFPDAIENAEGVDYGDDEDDIEYEDEDDDGARISEGAKMRRAETARRKKKGGDPRMSETYKAFMGRGRELVNPFFTSPKAFLEKWADIGNAASKKAHGKNKDDKTYKLKLVEVAGSDSDTAEEVSEETAAAMPTALLVGLRKLSFKRTINGAGVEIWELLGDGIVLASGHMITLMRNTDDMASPYQIVLKADVNSIRDRGRIIASRQLTSDTKVDKIMSTINMLIDRVS